ncbi:hypothetical protein BSKO_02168 [Bryopsis sp. KO-2023]|nr:hypothetical protein BSKO_02168 [Bryopsis sp. KO-2023]
MKGELKQRRLLKVSKEGDMRLVPSPVVQKENQISKTAPYRQIFVRKRDRDQMKVQVCNGSVRVTLENEGFSSAQRRRVRTEVDEAKEKDRFQKPPGPALVSDNDESSVPEGHPLKPAVALRSRCGTRVRHPPTASWLRKRRLQPHSVFPFGKESVKSPEGATAMQGNLIEPMPKRRPRKATKPRGGVKVVEGLDVGSAISGSNHIDVTSLYGSEGSHSERSFAPQRSSEDMESMPDSSDGYGHSVSEAEKNDTDCWEPSETGHNRVIKRRKLSERELHMACMKRNTMSRSRRYLEKSSYKDQMNRGVVRCRLPRDSSPKQQTPTGYLERHTTSEDIVQEGLMGTAHGSEDGCDAPNGVTRPCEDVARHRRWENEEGMESEQFDTMDGGGTRDRCAVKEDRNSEELDAAETFKVNTDGMRWSPGGYRNEEGRVATFSKLSDIVDQVIRTSQKTYHSRPPPRLVVRRLPREEKNLSPTLYTSPVQSTRSSKDTCTPIDLSPSMSNSRPRYAHARVLNVERDVPPVITTSAYQDIRDSGGSAWRSNYNVARPVEVIRGHGDVHLPEWSDARGVARTIVQNPINSSQHRHGVSWSDYRHQDLGQPREEVQILIPSDRVRRMNIVKPEEGPLVRDSQAKLKKQLVDLLNRHGLSMPVGGIGVGSNSNPPPPPRPLPSLPTNPNNSWGRIGVNVVGDSEILVQHQARALPAQKARYASARPLSRFLGGGGDGGSVKSAGAQSFYVRLANQGDLGGSNGVMTDGGSIPVMFLKKQGLMRLRK